MSLIKCSECGKEISDKATTCIHCGCPIEKELVCIECGNKINRTDKVCKKCGCPINNKIKNKKVGKIFTIIWLIICILTCLIISIINFTNIFNLDISIIQIANLKINVMGILALLLGGTYVFLLTTFSKKSLYLLFIINALILIYNVLSVGMIINLFYIVLVLINSLITFLIMRKQLKKEKLKFKHFIPLFITLILCIIITIITSNQNNFEETKSNERDYSVAQIEVITDYINIRDKKSVNSNILGEVNYGEIYTIISEDKTSTYNWYEIETSNGIRGFIAGKNQDIDYVKELESTNTEVIEDLSEEIKGETTTKTTTTKSNKNKTNNSTSNNNSNTTTKKVCDESAKQQLTNEYNTTLEQRVNEYNANVEKTQKQIEIAKEAIDSTGGYLSQTDYNTQYQEATSQVQKELLKNRYNMSVNYDKIVSTFEEAKRTFNEWKETYNKWYQEELSKIGC